MSALKLKKLSDELPLWASQHFAPNGKRLMQDEGATSAFFESLSRQLDGASAEWFEEAGEILCERAKIAIRQHYIGKLSAFDRAELHCDVVANAWPRVMRWKPGKQKIESYCFVAACQALIDVMNSRNRKKCLRSEVSYCGDMEVHDIDLREYHERRAAQRGIEA